MFLVISIWVGLNSLGKKVGWCCLVIWVIDVIVFMGLDFLEWENFEFGGVFFFVVWFIEFFFLFCFFLVLVDYVFYMFYIGI